MKELYFVNSLEKVFPDEAPGGRLEKISMLRNERYSFQLAIFCEKEETPVTITPPAELADCLHLYTVGLIPVHVDAKEKCEDDFLLREGKPGLYPDLLVPCDTQLTLRGKGWRSIWLEIEPKEPLAAGRRECAFSVVLPEGKATVSLTLAVVNALLPEQSLICTHWFYCDCLADQFQTPVFSEAHWQIIEKYIRFAVKHGINMILTPLFTPPLDTAVGKERPTVQLVGVTAKDYQYTFDFSLLDRWIDLCLSCGVQYFEMSHLFTQWGARHAPKIMAETADGEKRLFGWETNASGAEYKHFLKCFAAALNPFLAQKGIQDRCFFHVADEPGFNDLLSYQQAAKIIEACFGAYRCIDALSEYVFYKNGLTKTPIPCINAIDAFRGKVPELWTYYCSVPAKENYVNRFVYYPSVRNRALGAALYAYDCKGFLHWGYNFWYTVLSTARINPFEDTASGGGFPAGDGFVVYPGENGEPLPSLRLKVFYDSLQDERALRLLEAIAGREAAMQVLQQAYDGYSFRSYPATAEGFLSLREQINNAIADRCS